MTYEERLEAAERHRLKGNALFLEVRATPLFKQTFSMQCLIVPNLILYSSNWGFAVRHDQGMVVVKSIHYVQSAFSSNNAYALLDRRTTQMRWVNMPWRCPT